MNGKMQKKNVIRIKFLVKSQRLLSIQSFSFGLWKSLRYTQGLVRWCIIFFQSRCHFVLSSLAVSQHVVTLYVCASNLAYCSVLCTVCAGTKGFFGLATKVSVGGAVRLQVDLPRLTCAIRTFPTCLCGFWYRYTGVLPQSKDYRTVNCVSANCRRLVNCVGRRPLPQRQLVIVSITLCNPDYLLDKLTK